MPSNCSPGPSSLTVTYEREIRDLQRVAGLQDHRLLRPPLRSRVLSAAIVKDAHDSGTSVTTTITQNADEASTSAQALTLPFPAWRT